MSDLVVIVPSRGRPEAVEPLAAAFIETCTADTRLLWALDESDPAQQDYIDKAFPSFGGVIAWDTHTMVEALNHAATTLESEPFAIGFLGDDHRPRTKGWDERYLEALRELGTGIVYGDDLLRGELLPTQCAMTSDIVQALGWMAPPTLRHLYVDNFWRELGQRACCLRYLPDVVVEHMHPVAGKAQMDAGYERVNAPEVNDADSLAYFHYVRGGLADDVDRLRALVAR